MTLPSEFFAAYPSLEVLSEFALLESWEYALPSRMSEAWLHGVAVDLRELDAESPNQQVLLRPTQLCGAVSYALLRARGATSKDVKSFNITRALIAYQYVVEREIVNRMPGMPSVDRELSFIAYIDELVSEGLGA